MTSRAFACLLFLSLTSCGPYDDLGGQGVDPVPASPYLGARMLVESGPVIVTSPDTLQGSFSIRRAKDNEYGIENSTLGGACLIARVQPTGGLCMRDADCKDRYKSIRDDTNYGAEYCIGQHGDIPTGSCFVKPDETYCVKGLGRKFDHPTAIINATKVKHFAAERKRETNVDQRVDWMVYSCLNGPDVEAPDPAAPGTTKMFKPCARRFEPVEGMVEMYSAGTTLRYP